MTNTFKIGLFGTGLDTYWAQFDGLLDSLKSYQTEIRNGIISRTGAEVVDAGLVDNPESAIAAASLFASEEVDMVFLYVATYCLSSTILPVAQRLNCPLIILNLQPVPAIDYNYINSLGDKGKMTGFWLAHCQACSVPEIASVFRRSGLKYEFVTGYLHDPQAWAEITEWTEAARVRSSMRNNRLGVLGHYYCGMLDVYTDLTRQSATFGTHIELPEMCELKKYRDEATKEEIQAKISEFHERFDVSPECEQYEIERAARTSVALDKLVAAHRLGSLAYYYEGCDGNEYENIVTSVIAGNTLLTGKNIPVAGECEVKNAQAMKIMAEFGAGGSFSEFYAMDFNDDVVLLGHDGPAHFAIAEGRVGLVPLPVYHGKPGKGLSIQMTVKHGPVTLLSVCEDGEGVYLLVAEGESVAGPTLQIGNTNSRYRFACGARSFINEWSKAGPSHHCAVGLGHIASKIEKFAFLLGIKVIKICEAPKTTKEETPKETLKEHPKEITVDPPVEQIAPTVIQNPEPQRIEPQNTVPQRTEPQQIEPQQVATPPSVPKAKTPSADYDPPSLFHHSSLGEALGKKIFSDLNQSLSLNQRFAFKRDIFGGSEARMNEAIGQLNGFQTLAESVNYLENEFHFSWDSDAGIELRELLDLRFA